MKPFKYCRHVKQDGIPCGSPPLRGENYCHYHLRYKGYPLRTWPTGAGSEDCTLPAAWPST